MQSAHEFALYTAELSSREQALYTIKDPELVHRISHVLRCTAGSELILFNREIHAEFTITAINKTSITGTLSAPTKNSVFTPHLVLYVPLLKRAALEEALYTATEIGVQEIQLITTQKTPPWTDKELPRLERIIIAASEQSKNFAFPTFHAPIRLEAVLAKTSKQTVKIYADASGKPLLETMQHIAAAKPASLIFMVGPAGDLTHEEKAAVAAAGFDFCALTPTVLRSQQAVAVGLGALRSL